MLDHHWQHCLTLPTSRSTHLTRPVLLCRSQVSVQVKAQKPGRQSSCSTSFRPLQLGGSCARVTAPASARAASMSFFSLRAAMERLWLSRLRA